MVDPVVLQDGGMQLFTVSDYVTDVLLAGCTLPAQP